MKLYFSNTFEIFLCSIKKNAYLQKLNIETIIYQMVSVYILQSFIKYFDI